MKSCCQKTLTTAIEKIEKRITQTKKSLKDAEKHCPHLEVEISIFKARIKYLARLIIDLKSLQSKDFSSEKSVFGNHKKQSAKSNQQEEKT